MNVLDLSASIGALTIISESTGDVLGLSDAEYKLVSDGRPWLSADRPAVVRTLEAFVFGGMEAQGLGRIEVPSEFVAAVIYVVVDPINVRRACKWVEGSGTAEGDLGVPRERVTSFEMLAMVMMLYADEQKEITSPMRGKFRKAMDIKIRKGEPI